MQRVSLVQTSMSIIHYGRHMCAWGWQMGELHLLIFDEVRPPLLHMRTDASCTCPASVVLVPRVIGSRCSAYARVTIWPMHRISQLVAALHCYQSHTALCTSCRALAAVHSSAFAERTVTVQTAPGHAVCNHAMPCAPGAPCQEEAPIQLHHEGAARSAKSLEHCIGAYTCNMCFVELLERKACTEAPLVSAGVLL